MFGNGHDVAHRFACTYMASEASATAADEVDVTDAMGAVRPTHSIQLGDDEWVNIIWHCGFYGHKLLGFSFYKFDVAAAPLRYTSGVARLLKKTNNTYFSFKT